MRKTTGPNFGSGRRTIRGERVPWPREASSSRASLASGPKPYSYCHHWRVAAQEVEKEQEQKEGCG